LLLLLELLLSLRLAAGAAVTTLRASNDAGGGAAAGQELFTHVSLLGRTKYYSPSEEKKTSTQHPQHARTKSHSRKTTRSTRTKKRTPPACMRIAGARQYHW
jgi:hypothetical protein